MTLSSWIVTTGPKNVAKLLKVDAATVSQWKNQNAFPRPKHLVKINKLSKGQVTYRSMIESFVKAKKN